MIVIACCLLLPSVTAMVPSSRLIEPADIVRVSVTLREPFACEFGPEDLYVHPDGTIQTESGLVIFVAGLTFAEVAERLRSSLSESYRCPLEDVSVAVEPSVAGKHEVWVIIHVGPHEVTNRVSIQEARDMPLSARKIPEYRVWIERPTKTGYGVLDLMGPHLASDPVLHVGDRVHVSKGWPISSGTMCVSTGWSPATLLPDSVVWAIRVLLKPWW